MLDANQAAKAALRALRLFMPEGKFALSPLKDPTKRYETWVFQCKLRGENQAFVCKLGARDAGARAKILNQYQQLLEAKTKMRHGQMTAPQALAYFETECAFIMQYVKGSSFRHLLADFVTISDAHGHLKGAGQWLRAFHDPTMKAIGFDPAPHMSWIGKKLSRLSESGAWVPSDDSFRASLCELERLAQACAGQPSFRCITHRDFHLGNVIFGRKNMIYGIDFENKKEDVALRDVLSFLYDFTIRWQTSAANWADFQRAAIEFWRAYGDETTDPRVLAFFQKFTALNAWSGMDGRHIDEPKNLKKLRVLEQLAQAPLIDPAAI